MKADAPVARKNLSVTLRSGCGPGLTDKPLLGLLTHKVAFTAEGVAEEIKPLAYLYPSGAYDASSFHFLQRDAQ